MIIGRPVCVEKRWERYLLLPLLHMKNHNITKEIEETSAHR